MGGKVRRFRPLHGVSCTAWTMRGSSGCRLVRCRVLWTIQDDNLFEIYTAVILSHGFAIVVSMPGSNREEFTSTLFLGFHPPIEDGRPSKSALFKFIRIVSFQLRTGSFSSASLEDGS
ncbi:hypothetical protein V6N13_094495 [Hibiscus sabdariffa]